MIQVFSQRVKLSGCTDLHQYKQFARNFSYLKYAYKYMQIDFRFMYEKSPSVFLLLFSFSFPFHSFLNGMQFACLTLSNATDNLPQQFGTTISMMMMVMVMVYTLPRIIQNYCDTSLLLLHLMEKQKIGEGVVRWAPNKLSTFDDHCMVVNI